MKKLRKGSILLLCALLLAAALGGCGGGDAPAPAASGGGESAGSASGSSGGSMVIRWAGNPTGGTTYMIAVGMSDILMNEHPQYSIAVDATTNSGENARMMYTGESQIGWTNSNIMYWANNAMNEGGYDFSDFETDQFRLVLGGITSHLQIFVAADSDIQSFGDIRGKKIAVGRGQAATIFFPLLLEHYGLTEDDVSISTLDLADVINALNDGTADMAFVQGNLPYTGFSDLATTKDLRMIPLDEGIVNAIHEAEPFYVPATIPPGTYNGVDYDVLNVGCYNPLMCRADLDEDFVYNFVKSMCENNEALVNIHPLGGAFNAENTLDAVVIPLHPGAERYFQEIGML